MIINTFCESWLFISGLKVFVSHLVQKSYVFEVNEFDMIFIILIRNPLIVCFCVFSKSFTLYSTFLYTCSENGFLNFTVSMRDLSKLFLIFSIDFEKLFFKIGNSITSRNLLIWYKMNKTLSTLTVSINEISMFW